jgi:hypothetical protein
MRVTIGADSRRMMQQNDGPLGFYIASLSA